MPPNLFPLEPTNHHRADTIALKKRLQELLPGPEGRTYWRAFSELLGAQITRKEFDAATSAILSSNEAAAETHNALILAVLYNVFQPTEHYVTPHKPRKSLGHHDGEGGGWFDGAKRKAAEETPEDRTRERAKQAVMALGKRERSRLKRLPDLLSQPTPSFMQPRASPFMQSPAQSPGSTTKPVDIQEQARWDAVESCSAAGDLPRDPASLGDRMSSIAHRINLHSAGPEAGQLMMDAVQMLQSGILNSIADYLKSQQKSQMTLADTDDLFSIRPDLVAPSSHPLSHLVDSALTKFNQRRVLSGMRMPKQRRLPLVEAKAAEQPDGEKAGAGTDLAGELFPETKETKKVWEVVDTQAILGDLLL